MSGADLRARARADLGSLHDRGVRVFGACGELIAAGRFEGIALALLNSLYSPGGGHIPLYKFSDRDPGPRWDASHRIEVD